MASLSNADSCLRSLFIGLLQIRDSVEYNPYQLLEEFEDRECEAYAGMKLAYERGDVSRNRPVESTSAPEKPCEFFSFEEFTRWREHYGPVGNADLAQVYRDLLQRPTEESINVNVQVKQAIKQLAGQSNLRGIMDDWGRMEAYWKWVAQLYGPEMVRRFGGLNVMELGLLPIGMVSMLRQKRMKWQG